MNYAPYTDDEFTAEELAADDILKYFVFAHLRSGDLAAMSSHFAELAKIVVRNAPRCPERTMALRKILEGKDAAVRTML